MKFNELSLKGAFTVDLDPHADERGFFARAYCDREFAAAGIDFRVVQANMSRNDKAGTLRGMHYQLGNDAEDKFVRCLRGRIVDVIVDMRKGSPTFMQHEIVELSPENLRAILVPKGFAHGIQALEDDTDILYLVSAFYAPGSERGLRWNDPALGIKWPTPPTVMTDKDQSHPDYDPAIHDFV